MTGLYKVLISKETESKLSKYLKELQDGSKIPGRRLEYFINSRQIDLKSIDEKDLLDLLFATKIPQVFAESQDFSLNFWIQDELNILGDASVAAEVMIYDNGVHRGEGIKEHDKPFTGELLFVPSALLNTAAGSTTPDLTELIKDGEIDKEAFYALYERRLMPLLYHANNNAPVNGAIVTVPGLGCGAFAGYFIDSNLEKILQEAFVKILTKHAADLPNIRALIYDTNTPNKCFEGVIPITDNLNIITVAGKFGTESSQLRHPSEYDVQYADCKLYSIVAWDHISWPGNDFYNGFSRVTDDGVKAAATNVISVITGLEGYYHIDHKMYLPGKPEDNYPGHEKDKDWQQVAKERDVKFSARNLEVFEVKDEKQAYVSGIGTYNDVNELTVSEGKKYYIHADALGVGDCLNLAKTLSENNNQVVFMFSESQSGKHDFLKDIAANITGVSVVGSSISSFITAAHNTVRNHADSIVYISDKDVQIFTENFNPALAGQDFDLEQLIMDSSNVESPMEKLASALLLTKEQITIAEDGVDLEVDKRVLSNIFATLLGKRERDIDIKEKMKVCPTDPSKVRISIPDLDLLLERSFPGKNMFKKFCFLTVKNKQLDHYKFYKAAGRDNTDFTTWILNNFPEELSSDIESLMTCQVTMDTYTREREGMYPCVTADGHTYSKVAVEEIMRTTKKDPITRETWSVTPSKDNALLVIVDALLDAKERGISDNLVPYLENAITRASYLLPNFPDGKKHYAYSNLKEAIEKYKNVSISAIDAIKVTDKIFDTTFSDLSNTKDLLNDVELRTKNIERAIYNVIGKISNPKDDKTIGELAQFMGAKEAFKQKYNEFEGNVSMSARFKINSLDKKNFISDVQEYIQKLKLFFEKFTSAAKVATVAPPAPAGVQLGNTNGTDRVMASKQGRGI
jgi:hypothetical protein